MTDDRLTALKSETRAVLAAVEAEGDALFADWAAHIARPGFTPGARNLADYLALRHHDLNALQERLAELGLSSLGRAESRIRPALAALSVALGRLTGEQGRWPEPDWFNAGIDEIARAQEAFFGPHAADHATRIMVTLPGEAADDPALIAALLSAGATCLRINCAHDDAGAWAKMIAHVRARDAESGRHTPVIMDLGGPKIRVEAVHSPHDRLFRGDRFRIVARKKDLKGSLNALTISFPHLLERLEPGAPVRLDDGKIGAVVLESGPREVLLEVTAARSKGVRLKPEKGVNFPALELDLAPLTEKDFADLDFVAQNADVVGYSFVQRPEDVTLLQDALAARRGAEAGPHPLMLKIETPLAVRNLPRLVVAAGGRNPVSVMIARGDLAIEVGPERLSEVQEEILWLCEAAHVPVVWATQVLESLVKEGVPSRAEVTDAAMGQRAECVMLNKGPFIVEGVAFLAGILHRMDRHQFKKSARLSTLTSWQGEQRF